MCITLRRIRAALLRRLASGEPVDIGEVGPSDPYPGDIRQRIGPMVSSLRRAGLITQAGSCLASRPTRHATFAPLWRSPVPADCGRMADVDDAYLASHRTDDDDDDPPASGLRQLTLF